MKEMFLRYRGTVPVTLNRKILYGKIMDANYGDKKKQFARLPPVP